MKHRHTNGHTKLAEAFVVSSRNGSQIVKVPTVTPARQMDLTQLMNPRDLAQVIEYRLAEMMGMAGFSIKAIAQTLGLKSWEASYRLKRANVKLKDYRSGDSPLAREVIGRLDLVAQKRLVNNLEKYLLK